MGRFRIGSRQNRCLNAACDFEFLLNFAELMVAMQTALCGYVAKGSEEEGEALPPPLLSVDFDEDEDFSPLPSPSLSPAC